MRIIHVSYAPVPDVREPSAWLKRINFFTGIATSMSALHEVHSIHCIGYNGSVSYQGVIYHFFKPNLWRRLFSFTINRMVKKLDPDVIIVHGLHFSWQIFLLHFHLPAKVSVFAQHHAEKPVAFYKKILHHWNDSFIKGYFFSAADLAAPWVELQLIKNKNKIHEVIEVSSSFEPTDRNVARKKTGVQGGLSYLWVGRLDANKDPETLLKAFIRFGRSNPEATLYLIFQEDQLLSQVRRMAGELPAQIKLIGKVEHHDLLHWYNSVDFVVSTSHYESSGIAVCEGMSCGCFPILSDIPSFRKMTADASVGILFSPGDAEGLALALKRSTSVNLQHEREKVLLQFRKNLSFDGIAEKMIQTISR